MKLLFFAYIISTATCVRSQSQTTSVKDSTDLFVGTTPCSNVIRPLHKIAQEADCELKECKCIMVEWKLTLYKNPVTQKPTRYKLTGINRFSVRETNMYSQPGTKTDSEGNWTIARGTKANPDAVLYQLNPDKPGIMISLVKLSDHLLHVLDHDGKLMIGNEFWSYTLTRVITTN